MEIITDSIKVTIAIPYSFMTKDEKFFFTTDRIFPYPGDNLGFYFDYNGKTVEEQNTLRKVVSLTQVLEGIRTSPVNKRRCGALRDPNVSKEDKKHIKMTGLKRLYWGDVQLMKNDEGKFKYMDIGVVEHPGVVCFDADNLSPENVIVIQDRLRDDKYTLCGFISPRGNGYKWLVRVPKEPENHRSYYRALVEYYKWMFGDFVTLDENCINPARACFVSYDPNPLINQQAEIWTEKRELATVTVLDTSNYEGNDEQKYKRAKFWMEKDGEFWQRGNHNRFQFLLACKCKKQNMSLESCLSFIGSEFGVHDGGMPIKSAYRRK